nr:sulfite exporter TauE/SafE family protein [Massilia sp. JS1662]
MFGMTASYFAARFANKISANALHVAFAVFLLLLAAYFGYERKRASGLDEHAAERPPAMIPRAAPLLLGIVSGAMSGIFTIGGGLFVVPVLVSLFGMKQTRAQGMALALVVPGALISLAAYAQDEHVNWLVGIPMALGGILSVSWGVKLAHRCSATHLRLLFCVVLLSTALMMLTSPH